MEIGIIVYSQTGHTLEVCGKLRDRLIGEGRAVTLEQVTITGEPTPRARTFELENRPDSSPYDAIVFASYVEAFSLCRVMDRYLRGIESLEGKKVAFLVTEQFPYPWMGGNHAIRQMKRLCSAKGATLRAEAVVNWAESRREKTMSAALSRLSKAF